MDDLTYNPSFRFELFGQIHTVACGPAVIKQALQWCDKSARWPQWTGASLLSLV
jgi:hypothetical protein